MQAEFTRHALEKIFQRPVVTPDEVLEAVNRKIAPIRRVKADEALVLVKWLERSEVFPDGSNGEAIVACVDPDTLLIKTVMLRRRQQVQKNNIYGVFV